jgi:hypothetical protein
LAKKRCPRCLELMTRGAYRFHRCPGTPPPDPKWARAINASQKALDKKPYDVERARSHTQLVFWSYLLVVVTLFATAATLAHQQYRAAISIGLSFLVSSVVFIVASKRGPRR